ncbi:MAG: carboxypeptidase-like regulatory domain-containing protein [Cytophagales bacterium]|nr:MAG: carboxypeptidase-like regulatory domain-containing protein [Cytophagales bacterium]
MQKIFVFILFIVVAFSISGQKAWSQGERKVITLSGLIVQGDSAYGVPGVNVYVPKAGRGVFTDYRGFFSMPTLEGDTIIISAIGYQKQRLIVPRVTDMSYHVVVNLKESTIMLAGVEVLPYSDEEEFKEAFVALNLPSKELENMQKNLSPTAIRNMAFSMPMDGSLNYKFYLNQQSMQMGNRNFATTIPFLNPFAWIELIKSIKRGDFKRKDNRRSRD